MTRLWYLARREGLNIPFPIQMEYRPGEDPSKPQKSTSQWLNEQPRFKIALQPSDLAILDLREFTQGELLHTPNRSFEGCALILRGDIEILASTSDGQELFVANISTGECFGENLTAGSSSDAITLRARTDVTLLWLPSTEMDKLLNRSPSLSSEVGDAIELRRLAVQAVLKQHHAPTLRDTE
jgi:CRP-like cAMP-binding protein